MAENLLWLLGGPLAGHKVIVWAHNYHVLRDLPMAGAREAMEKSGSLGGPMGMKLAKALGQDLFVLGFAAHHGRYGYAGEKPVDLPAVDASSFEGLLHALGRPWLLLNLRGLPPDHWLNAPLSSGFYFYEQQTTNMPRLYDAIFFLDEMTPSTAVEPPPQTP
jgi:erythromycin esterase-like protein